MTYNKLKSTHPPGLWQLTLDGLKTYGYRQDQKYICEIHEDGSYTYVDTPGRKNVRSLQAFGGVVGLWELVHVTPEDLDAETDF